MPAQPIRVSVLAALLLACQVAMAAQAKPELESTMGLMMAEKETDGYTIVPSTLLAPTGYTEDLAPPQVFEIVRPGMGPITVGRLMSSCGCLLVTMEKKEYAEGEPARILVRNVKPTVKDGATYAFFVQVEKPVKTALQYDLFVKSGPWDGSAVAMGSRNPLRTPPRPTPPTIDPPSTTPPNINPPTPDRPNITRPTTNRPNITPPTTTKPSITRPRAEAPDFGTPSPGRDNTADGPGLNRSEIVPGG